VNPVGRRCHRILLVLAALLVAMLPVAAPALAVTYVPISGAGSTWSQNALDQWRKNVNQYGMTINYQGSGSSDGRNQFRNGTVDFAVSEIPFGLKDSGVVDNPPARKYAYMPIVAGGTSFMYNLKIGGQQVTNLRLSGEVITRIFTGAITNWSDPAIAADNPGLTLPARKVVPVVRSDGSGTSAQFTAWMANQYGGLWDAYCAKAGLPTPCGQTSQYPVLSGSGFVSQSGSLGVSGFVQQAQNEGTINYVEYSYPLQSGFPVAKVLNRANYYVEPTPSNVAVGLLQARINNDENSPNYLTQQLDGVYNNADKRAYPLSSYSYMILPIKAESGFSTDKGATLGAFAHYFLCEGQQQAPDLGYSPLPINLVKAGLDQVSRIPGAGPETTDISKCNNPTFSPDGTNTLARTAPQPNDCDAKGADQCGIGTAGAKAATPVSTDDNAGDGAGSGSDAAAAAGGGGGGGGSSAGRGQVAAAGGANPAARAAAGSAGAAPAAGAGGVAGATGARAGTPGAVGTSGTGTAARPGVAAAAPGTAVAPGSAAAAAPVIDPDTGEVLNPAAAGGATTVDPATGAVVTTADGAAGTAAGTAAGGRPVSAVPVSVSAYDSSALQHLLAVVAVLLLVGLVLGPPLLSRTLDRRRSL